MNSPTKNIIRVSLIILILLNGGFLLDSATADEVVENQSQQMEIPLTEREPLIPPTTNVTVVTGQATPTVQGGIAAFLPDGRLLYHESRFDTYFDVDPSPRGAYTVVFVASTQLSKTECDADARCRKNVVVRLNLSTGQRTNLYSVTYPRFSSLDHYRTVMIHDVDVIDKNHLLVADIARNRVFIVNTKTGIISWSWTARSRYSRSGGGVFPYDWTHLNDVEQLDDGRIMVSLRNQDQVVFINKSSGVIPEWTLGNDDNHSILYEQHNPDYIPEEMGGPAVLVADSENNRIVEYQRSDESWERSWVWRDSRLQWPRDADRLPNGNTIIADVYGNRIIEVNRTGKIVWEMEAGTTYDVERLETGDESIGGHSARSLDLENRNGSAQEGVMSGQQKTREFEFEQIKSAIKSIFPSKLVNGFFFITPLWFHLEHLVSLLLLLSGCIGFMAHEIRHSKWEIRVCSPIDIDHPK